jgi:hypothetical protein
MKINKEIIKEEKYLNVGKVINQIKQENKI